MNVYKILTSQHWDKFIYVVLAKDETEAKSFVSGDIDEITLIPGITVDPTIQRKPVVFNNDGTPNNNILVYEWFPAN